jgi:arylsulfatase A-like enzyme
MLNPHDSLIRLSWILLASTVLAPSPALAADSPARRPNVLLILADDLGYADLGCQGCRDVPTPHIDQLARDGVRFTNGYVTCPVCSPTRAALLTGRYGQRYGHEFNPGPPVRGPERPGLPVGERTLADRLKALGYATALIGKWHLGGDPPHHPLRRGFDEFFGFLAGMHTYRGEDPGDRILRGTEPVDEKEYLTDAFTREAEGFIERNRARPFFLYLAYNAVHMPLQKSPRHAESFAEIADPNRRTFAGMLAALDDGVGRVLAKVRELGLDDDTLIFFLSDNGGITPRNTSRNDPLRGTKGQVWEGGIRVPFIARWKGRFPAGAVREAPVSCLDIVPTALAAAGSPPSLADQLDGLDLAPLLESGAVTGRAPRTLFWRFGPQAAIREGDLKLVLPGKAPPQLFDLRADPSEKADLAMARPEETKRLLEAWRRWNSGLIDARWGPPPGDHAEDLVVVPGAGDPPAGSGRLRVMVETDAGGDPDDEQSLVRFLLYTNEWDVEGIIANRTRAREGENLNEARTGLGIVRRQLLAYAACHQKLVLHDPRYPDPAKLAALTVAGDGSSDDGEKLVIAAADAPDPRPIWYMDWGTEHEGAGPNCLRRALDRMQKERGPEGYARFKRRFRLSSADAFGPHTAGIDPPWELWVDTFRPEKDGKRWYHRFSALTATAGGFDLKRDVLEGHGPLGALYPTNTTHRQKEGDTMTFLYLVPTGMNDPEHPEWGSWAGRYAPMPGQTGRRYYWADAPDSWDGTVHRENSLRRWAVHLQNDFRARLEWCVRDFAHANHPPRPEVRGALERTAKPGQEVVLDASGSSDPDGQPLAFEWAFYPEAGNYRGALPEIRGSTSPRASFIAPPAEATATVHVVLIVTDAGTPALTRYRRVIVTLAPEK